MAEDDDRTPVADADETAAAEAPAEAAEEVAAEGAELDPAALQAELEAARQKAEDNWNLAVRAQAEMENLRKRSERDLANAHKFALEKFAADLLPVRDSLEMGLSHAGEDAEVAALREGMELTLKNLSNAMEKHQLVVVDPVGEKFNPDLHEAMAMQPAADAEPNSVLTVVQKGYTLNERLIRPAMVIVAKAP